MTRFLLVVAAVDQARANQDARLWDPAGGHNSFTVPLSPTGVPPATHYWACAVASPPTYAAIAAKIEAEYPLATLREWNLDAYHDGAEALLTDLGLKRVTA